MHNTDIECILRAEAFLHRILYSMLVPRRLRSNNFRGMTARKRRLRTRMLRRPDLWALERVLRVNIVVLWEASHHIWHGSVVRRR
jgi:hypothetical protein